MISDSRRQLDAERRRVGQRRVDGVVERQLPVP